MTTTIIDNPSFFVDQIGWSDSWIRCECEISEYELEEQKFLSSTLRITVSSSDSGVSSTANVLDVKASDIRDLGVYLLSLADRVDELERAFEEEQETQ